MIEFEKEEDANDIHEGRVKLEVDLGGAYVVASAQNSFHHERQAEGKEYAVLLWDAHLLLAECEAPTVICGLLATQILRRSFMFASS